MSDKPDDHILFRVENGVAYLTLNQPAKMSTMTAMVGQIAEDVTHLIEGLYKAAAPVAHFIDALQPEMYPAPTYRARNQKILADFDFTSDQIDRLINDRAVLVAKEAA